MRLQIYDHVHVLTYVLYILSEGINIYQTNQHEVSTETIHNCKYMTMYFADLIHTMQFEGTAIY